jgi:drug/metabolite transporter (DMT)-like permease
MAFKDILFSSEAVISESKRPRLLILFAIILLHQVIASFAYPVAKVGLRQVDPFIFAFFRFIIASAIYVLIFIFSKKGPSISKPDRLRIFLVGVLIIPINQLLFLVGQALTTASHGALLFATTPIFIYILAIILLGEKATFSKTVGIFIALAGVFAILAGGKMEFGKGNLSGDLIIIISVVAWALATILGKPLAQKYGAIRSVGLAIIYGSVVYLPLGAYKAISGDYSRIDVAGWISILYLAIFLSVIAYVLWYWIMKYMEASRVAVVQNIQPIIASAVAALFLAEPISRNLVAGGIIIIGGVILTEI